MAYRRELHQPVACELDESCGGRQRARSQFSPSGYSTGIQQKASAESCVCPYGNKQAARTELRETLQLSSVDNMIWKAKAAAGSLDFTAEALMLRCARIRYMISKGRRLRNLPLPPLLPAYLLFLDEHLTHFFKPEPRS